MCAHRIYATARTHAHACISAGEAGGLGTLQHCHLQWTSARSGDGGPSWAPGPATEAFLYW